jgi:hypothetical protein
VWVELSWYFSHSHSLLFSFMNKNARNIRCDMYEKVRFTFMWFVTFRHYSDTFCMNGTQVTASNTHTHTHTHRLSYICIIHTSSSVCVLMLCVSVYFCVAKERERGRSVWMCACTRTHLRRDEPNSLQQLLEVRGSLVLANDNSRQFECNRMWFHAPDKTKHNQ